MKYLDYASAKADQNEWTRALILTASVCAIIETPTVASFSCKKEKLAVLVRTVSHRSIRTVAIIEFDDSFKFPFISSPIAIF